MSIYGNIKAKLLV